MRKTLRPTNPVLSRHSRRTQVILPQLRNQVLLSCQVKPFVKVAIRLIFANKSIPSNKKIGTSTDTSVPVESPCLPDGALTGRRIVDFGYFTKQLICLKCGTLLHLKNFRGEERRHGLASEIPIQCEKCAMIRFIYTSLDSHAKSITKDRRQTIYDINCKLTVGKTELLFFKNNK